MGIILLSVANEQKTHTMRDIMIKIENKPLKKLLKVSNTCYKTKRFGHCPSSVGGIIETNHTKNCSVRKHRKHAHEVRSEQSRSVT